MKNIVLVLVSLLAVSAGLYLVLGGDRGPEAVGERSSREAVVAETPTETLELVETGEATESREAVAPGSTREAIAVAPGEFLPDAVEGDEVVWIEGQVRIPAGAPKDDLLAVYCMRFEVEHDELVQHLVAYEVSSMRQEDEPSSEGLERAMERLGSAFVSRRAVEPDGSFRLPVDAAEETLYLMVEGRFLYTPEGVPFAPAADSPIELDVALGAQVSGRVIAPKEGASVAGVEIEFQLHATSPNPGDYDGNLTIEADLPTKEDGSFEFHAIPTEYSWKVDAKPRELAASRTLIENLRPGELRSIEIPLKEGGVVHGEVLDPEDRPVAGATVEVMLKGSWFGFDDETVREARTNAQGIYELKGVAEGKLSLKADHPDFLESKRISVQVVDGEHVEAPKIQLTAGNTLEGRVLWADGTPAPGVDIEVGFDPAFMAGPSVFSALRGAEGEAVTDEEGKFAVRALGAGPFVVTARTILEQDEPGSGTLAEASAEIGGEESPEESLEEHVESEATWHTARKERVYPKVKDLVLRLHPPIGLEGRVTDSEKRPVDQFTVFATRESEGSMGKMTMETRRETYEDESGHFELEGMTEGSWKVHVTAEGHVTPAPVAVTVPRESGEGLLEIELVATAILSGRVLDPDGSPVPQAEVRVASGGPSWQSAFAGEDTTPRVNADAEGAFVFDTLPPGTVTLYAIAEGFAEGPAQVFEPGAGDTIEHIELLLAKGGTLTGLAYDAEGKPANGRFITLFSGDMEQRVATANHAGEFRVENLEAGSWQVISMDRQAEFSSNEDGSMGGVGGVQVTQAEIKEGETTHVVLGAPPADPVRVHGKVTHDGEPYAGGIVTFFPQGSRIYERMRFTDIDSKGLYSITVDGPGEYVVIVQRLGRLQTQQQNVEFTEEIPEVEEIELDFKVPLGRITGKVIGPDGQPAVGARVTLSSDGGFRSDGLLGGQYSEIETDGEGVYDLIGLRPGTYMIAAGGAPLITTGGEARTGRVTFGGIRLGEDEWKRGLDFRLSGPGSVEVSVTGPDGQPAKSAGVFFRDADGRVTEAFNFAATDSAGRYVARGLAVGEYTVSARLGKLASESSPVFRITEGGMAKVELRLDEGTILWIKLKDREKNDVRASLKVLDKEGHDWAGMFGLEDLQVLYGEGDFSPTEHRLGPLPPGKYRVTARAADGKSASKPVTVKFGEPERRITMRLK